MRELYEVENPGFSGRVRNDDVWGYIVATVIVVMLGLCVARAEDGTREADAEDASSKASERFAPPTVAVVNVRKVLSRCSQWKDARGEIERIQAKAESTLEKLQRRIRTLQIDYENLPTGTDRAQKQRKELRDAMEDYQETGEKYEEQLSEKRDEALSRILTQINSVVDEYADDHGIDVVLKSGDIGRDDGSSPEAVRAVLQRAATADVLYANDRYDISDEIAERLDASYATGISDPPGQ